MRNMEMVYFRRSTELNTSRAAGDALCETTANVPMSIFCSWVDKMMFFLHTRRCMWFTFKWTSKFDLQPSSHQTCSWRSTCLKTFAPAITDHHSYHHSYEVKEVSPILRWNLQEGRSSGTWFTCTAVVWLHNPCKGKFQCMDGPYVRVVFPNLGHGVILNWTHVVFSLLSNKYNFSTHLTLNRCGKAI